MVKEILLSELKLNNQQEEKTFIFNEQEFLVKQHISLLDKMILIDSILEDSLMESGTYNTVALQVYFTLYTLIFYSNLILDLEGAKNIITILDNIVQSGLAKEILNRIPETELENLNNLFKKEQRKREQYSMSIAGVIKSIVDSLPTRSEELKEILNNFDTEKFQEVINFTKAANGNREIK